MKIESINDGRIVVALSCEDMQSLDITYDEMDYSNIETRRVIWTVLDKARQSLGKPINTDGRLLIEVSPCENGGCTMFFTVVPYRDGEHNKKTVMKKGCEPMHFCADSADALIDAYKRLKSETSRLEKAECYSLHGCLYFVIYPKPSQSTYFDLILSDYGETVHNCPADTLAVCEYGKLLNPELLGKLTL